MHVATSSARWAPVVVFYKRLQRWLDVAALILLLGASLMKRVDLNADRLDDEFDAAASEVSRPEKANNSGLPSTWFGFLWQNEPRLLALSGFAQLSWSSFIMTGAYYFVNEMIRNRNTTTGLGLCFLYLGSIIIIVLSYQFKELWVGQMGASVKKALAARVAEHALLHGPLSAGDKSMALVLASQDAHSICEGAKNVWQLPAAISEGIVITALVIWRTTSLTGGITSGVLIAGFGFLFYMSRQMNKLKHDVTEIQDKQASLFGEVLANIRSFRYYGWDSYFLKRLHAMTDALIPAQQKLVVMKAVNSCLVIAFPMFPATALFVASYYDTGKSPTVPFQALVLSLLNTFRYPLWNLPSSLRAVSSANNSYARLVEFLGNFSPADSRSTSAQRGAVEISNLPVGARGSILKELRVAPGSLVILQGPVKSYKSTILKTLAGHYPVPKSATVCIGGSVSYAPQQPWMCQSTIQDNIVSFEQPVDHQRYQAVIRACALTQDFASMPLGDQTPVAEKGISLSGGQRQRVALARAAYRRADIYLLDNPISALDDATQEFVWENLFEGVLASATVIVASSRDVPSCSTIVRLSPGGIEGDPVQVSGWVHPAPTTPTPLRYSSPSLSFKSTLVSEPVKQEAAPKQRRRTSLVEMSKQDVSADALLFENYLNTELVARQSFVQADNQKEAEMLEAGTRSQRSQSFFDIIDKKREDAGVVSVRKTIGSRRVSYAELDGSNKYAPISEETIHDAALPVDAPKEKIPFLIWIDFTGMSKTTLAAVVFLYWFYPAPRLFIEQWIGFWAAKTYSADDQFNMNILALCFVGVIITRIVLDLFVFHYGAAAERNMRKTFCTTVINAPMTFFMTENLGPIISVFSRDLSIIGDELAQDFHAGVYYIIFNFAVSVFVCVRFPPFVAVAAVIYSSLIVLQYQYSQKIVLIRQEFQQAQDDVFRDLYDSLEGIEILRSACAEEWALKHLAESLQKNAIAIVAVEKTNVWLARRADFLAVCLCFATVMFVNYFETPANARGLMISGSMPILVLFNWSMKLLGNVHFLLNSVHRIQQYVDKVQSEDKKGRSVPPEFPTSGGIKFQDLSLRYRPSLPLALNRISFDLKHGAKVGVVGRTGSGKSTLMVALFRLIQPCGGSMIIDGLNVTDVAVDPLRRQMAIIPQDPAMFQGILRDNLDPYGEFSDQEVRKAIYQVGLSETRDMLSTVQASGEDWSLGEKQLVCLARVLLKRPKVLCLDEATASLDAKTEAQFQKVLEENFADATILCIAHRTDTLKWCRARIVMQEGKVLKIERNT